MCNCRQQMIDKFKELIPGAESITGQYEMLSGRSYSDYDIKMPGKKKPEKKMLLHSYCPHCGKPYEAKEGTV